MEKLRILKDVIIRHPLNPIKSVSNDKDVLIFFQNHFAQEALFIASHSLFKEYKKWEAGELDPKSRKKLISSLYRYYLRMHHRSTPFGLFAAVSAVKGSRVGSELRINSSNRYTRLDSSCLNMIIENIKSDKKVNKKLRYKVNSSLYKTNDQFRYIDVQQNVFGDNAEIKSILSNEVISEIAVFANRYRDYDELCCFLEEFSNSNKNIQVFVDGLIDSHFLICELNLSLSSEYKLSELIRKLKGCFDRHKKCDGLKRWIQKLTQLKVRLIRLDKRSINRPSTYKAIEKFLNNIGIRPEPQHIFQVDQNSIINGSIDEGSALFKDLKSLIPILAFNSTESKSKDLKDLVESFKKRYTDESVPLPLLMDPELGLGYSLNKGEDLKAKQSPLYKSFFAASNHNAHQAIKSFDKLKLQIRDKIDIEKDLLRLDEFDSKENQEALKSLPATFSVLVSQIINEKGETNYLLKDIGGAHALHYIGRFCGIDKGVMDIASSLAKFEKSHYEWAELTEFYHQSHIRSCNIASRPSPYNFSIDFLDNICSTKTSYVSDILVTVENDRLKLINSKTSKEIIPRISNAHDFRLNTLPLFKLIGDLQSQNKVNDLSFRVPYLDQLDYQPRITFKSIIVKAATWKFDAKELRKAIMSSSIRKWRKKYSVPRRVIIQENDRELLIDFENDKSYDLFIEELNKNKTISIREHFQTDPNFLRDHNGFSYANEILLFVENPFAEKKPYYPKRNESSTVCKGIKSEWRTDWIYLKLYVNQNRIEKLQSRIADFVDQVRRKSLIESWFFIRYRDPDNHLRLRFKQQTLSMKSQLIYEVFKWINQLQEDDFIWRYQIEPYEPELRRYGNKTIKVAEEIFRIDSEAFMRYIKSFPSEKGYNYDWQLSILYINDYFELLDLSLENRIEILSGVCNSFKKELDVNKAQLKLLSNNFRARRSKIRELLFENTQLSPDESQIIGIAAERSLKIEFQLKPLIKKAKVDVDFVLDLLHMSMNRLFMSSPRFHEFLSYDLVLNAYKSECARQSKNVADSMYLAS